MLKRDTKKMGCTCSGYHFFHRRGSKYCWYRVDGTDRFPGDADYEDRYPTVLFDELVDDDDDLDVPFDIDIIPTFHDHGQAAVPF